MKQDPCPICNVPVRVRDDAQALACGSCVQRLLGLARDEKLEQIARLRAEGHHRAARTIEKVAGLGRRARKRPPEKPLNGVLKNFRESRGMTQKQLAQEWGKTQQFIQKMEAGKAKIPLWIRKQIQPTHT